MEGLNPFLLSCSDRLFPLLCVTAKGEILIRSIPPAVHGIFSVQFGNIRSYGNFPRDQSPFIRYGRESNVFEA